MNHGQVTILVVDDDDVCHMMIQRGLQEMGSALQVVAAFDGAEALDLLRGRITEKRAPRPVVVLADLRMPRMSGLEFLEALRGDPQLSDTPVFVLSTSDHEGDIRAAYRLHAAGYMVKPVDRKPFFDMLRMVDGYCKTIAFPATSPDESLREPAVAGV